MIRYTWSIASILGQEAALADDLLQRIAPVIDSQPRLEEIRTAVTEACLNAMEHGNRFDARKKVRVSLGVSDEAIVIRIGDEGEGCPLGDAAPLAADRAAIWKLDNPRGWGIGFIRSFSDRVRTGYDEHGFYVELHFLLPCKRVNGGCQGG